MNASINIKTGWGSQAPILGMECSISFMALIPHCLMAHGKSTNNCKHLPESYVSDVHMQTLPIQTLRNHKKCNLQVFYTPQVLYTPEQNLEGNKGVIDIHSTIIRKPEGSWTYFDNH